MSKKGGFTLVELLVSIALFALFVITAISMLISFLRLNSANQAERQSLRGVVFVVENILREVRLGTNYRCSDTMNESVLSQTTSDCLKARIIKFKRGDGSKSNWITYRISGSGKNGKFERCQKQIDSSGMGICDDSDWATFSDKVIGIDVDSTYFDVKTGAILENNKWVSNGKQPSIALYLRGNYDIGNQVSKHISLNTRATQRPLGFGEIESEGFRSEIDRNLVPIRIAGSIVCYDRNGDIVGEVGSASELCTNIDSGGNYNSAITAPRVKLDKIFNIGGSKIYGLGSNNRVYSVNSDTGVSSVVGFPSLVSSARINDHFDQNRDLNNITKFFVGGDSIFAVRSDNMIYRINNNSNSGFTRSQRQPVEFVYEKNSITVLHTTVGTTHELISNKWVELFGIKDLRMSFVDVSIVESLTNDEPYVLFLNEEGDIVLRDYNFAGVESIVDLEEGANDILSLKVKGAARKNIEALVLFGNVVKKVTFTVSFPDIDSTSTVPISRTTNVIESIIDSNFNNVEIDNLLEKDGKYLYYRNEGDSSTQYRIFSFKDEISSCFQVELGDGRINSQDEGVGLTSVKKVSILSSEPPVTKRHVILINDVVDERRLVISGEGINENGCVGSPTVVKVDIFGPVFSNFNTVIVE